MSAEFMRKIREAHNMIHATRRKENTLRMNKMTIQELCRYRDMVRGEEGLGIKPEITSTYIQIVINGRKGK